MKTPLSWLRDFAPFDHDPAELAAVLDDLGLVVEAVDRVGEGLESVVVARVDQIAAIEGADRIRLVTADAGDGPVEIVCGATNFAVGDLVPLAPVGAVLPGGFEIARRKMRGVLSNGMLCSGRELGLSDDHDGLLILTQVDGARPGLGVAELLGIEPDVVFDITVEGNRPDAWCIAGIARDLAARLQLPFTLPTPAPAPAPAPAGGAAPVPVAELATLVIEDLDLCPRMTVRVLPEVAVGPSPRWLARRLVLAGMRPINNVVDASNYVMLELGQPTHPYDLDRLGGGGLRVRRARPGEAVVTLDGVERRLGTPGRGLGDTGEDCVICDAEGTPVGIGGIMGGESSEIGDGTTRVLLETAYFTPMAIARTSKRLALRTEASARFERGCDPWGIDRAADRFCELLGFPVAAGSLDVRGDVPRPLTLPVPVDRVNGVLGTTFDGDAVASLLEPIGFGCEVAGGPGAAAGGTVLTVTVPTNRPDVRPAPFGVDDVIEEVGRIYGYSRLPRRQPTWPEPGRLTARQRQRRLVRDVLVGLGGLEGWTPTFVADDDHALMGLSGPAVRVTNPLASEEAWLRRSMLPGLLRALAYNADRRQGDLRLFEVGTVFSHPDEPGNGGGRVVERSGAGGASRTVLPGERELVSVVLAAGGDDARTAVQAWRVLADAVGLADVRLMAAGSVPGLHPTRTALLVAGGSPGTVLGAVGEVDPDLAARFGLGRVGWLEVDLGLVATAPRRPVAARAVSRFPSSDVDLALVVDDGVPVDRVEGALADAGGDLLESVALFDVYRGDGVPAGRRSLAFRLRFCAADRTLTDQEVGELRLACIKAAEAVGAELR
ncbi:MAG TPA: phenylalanine--tRNA ligase subunit beta [Acidimicrobiales bacterium]|nr:phenylalanine--tRNA ligase subunit beta [Acidimicrobiales bacterium]